MVYKFFDKKSARTGTATLANKSEKHKVYSKFGVLI